MTTYLEGEGLFAGLGDGEKWLEEERALGELVVLQQPVDGPALVHVRVVRVQAKESNNSKH